MRTLPRKVGDYLRSLYFDTVCFEPGYLRFAAEVVPAEHLLLGSDAARLVDEKLKSLQAEFDAWKAVTLSTDVDENAASASTLR